MFLKKYFSPKKLFSPKKSKKDKKSAAESPVTTPNSSVPSFEEKKYEDDQQKSQENISKTLDFSENEPKQCPPSVQPIQPEAHLTQSVDEREPDTQEPSQSQDEQSAEKDQNQVEHKTTVGFQDSSNGQKSEDTSPHLEAKPSMLKGRSLIVSLSDEEKNMVGAPEGQIYQVVVLKTEEFHPSQNPSHVYDMLISDMKSSEWPTQFDATNFIRQLTIFHKELIKPIFNEVIDFLQGQLSNLRSTNIKNAMLCLSEIFLFFGKDEILSNNLKISDIICGLFKKLGSTQKFIVSEADKVISIYVDNCSLKPILFGVINLVNDSNKNVSCNSMQYFSKCLINISNEGDNLNSIFDFLPFDVAVNCLNTGLKCKVAAGKSATKNSLKTIRSAVGEEEFDKRVNEILSTTSAQDLINNSK